VRLPSRVGLARSRDGFGADSGKRKADDGSLHVVLPIKIYLHMVDPNWMKARENACVMRLAACGFVHSDLLSRLWATRTLLPPDERLEAIVSRANACAFRANGIGRN
jgi:hypothetical protein